MAAITDELIARLSVRARDPNRRNDVLPTALGRTIEVGPLAVTGIDLGALLGGAPQPPPQQASLPAPATDAALDAAERRLGLALPVDLRRVYREVADGGFGPGSGLLALDELVAAYEELTQTPPGRRGQPWPPTLLPVTATDPGHECVDTDDGSVVFWDEESLADGPSDKVWKRSFRPEAPDLATWLERWLGKPSPEEQMQAHMHRVMEDTIRSQLAEWRAKTPEERASYGLPETGWEEVLFGHLGVDLGRF